MPASDARTTFLILGLLIASTTNPAGSSSSGCPLAGSLAPPADKKWAPVSHLPLPLITLSNATTSAAAAPLAPAPAPATPVAGGSFSCGGAHALLVLR